MCVAGRKERSYSAALVGPSKQHGVCLLATIFWMATAGVGLKWVTEAKG
jgi:hypothetical protein